MMHLKFLSFSQDCKQGSSHWRFCLLLNFWHQKRIFTKILINKNSSLMNCFFLIVNVFGETFDWESSFFNSYWLYSENVWFVIVIFVENLICKFPAVFIILDTLFQQIFHSKDLNPTAPFFKDQRLILWVFVRTSMELRRF